MAESGPTLVAQNRRARHDYFIEETVEAGLVLTGTEVKSLRQGRASIVEAYSGDQAGELYLFNANIPVYEAASRFNHQPKRPRKLLVRRREMASLISRIRRDGYTLVPLKRKVDKRETTKKRDWQRDKARLLRDRG